MYLYLARSLEMTFVSRQPRPVSQLHPNGHQDNGEGHKQGYAGFPRTCPSTTQPIALARIASDNIYLNSSSLLFRYLQRIGSVNKFLKTREKRRIQRLLQRV